MSLFEDLLRAYTEVVADRKKIEQKLWHQFGLRGAVFVLDMADFSLITQKRGIVYYLSLIQQMQIVARPIIERFSGHIVKFEADNCFAYFYHPYDAIKAGITINRELTKVNQTNRNDLNIKVSCGIDYGDFLSIDGNDFFGQPVNRASKLGEDLARPGEILITEEALEIVKEDTLIHTKLVNYKLSGKNFYAFRIAYDNGMTF